MLILKFFKSLCLRISLTISLLSVSLSAFANATSFAELWATSGGHLGVSALDTANNQTVDYHAAQRFPMDSTFKLMLVAAVLQKSMSEPKLMQETLHYTQANMTTGWNPITTLHLGDGMTIEALCAAAISQSDNTAANLLMKKIGGPKAVTAFARSIGDTDFSLNRWEPLVNTNKPGDLRDTTTPAAMVKSLAKLTLGTTLGPTQRAQLITWLKASTTGSARIRAAVPQTWIVGDKTGTGDYGTTNDIGIIWPAHCPPVVIAVYYTQDQSNAPKREDIIATATHIALSKLARNNLCLDQAVNGP
jgi:beta-lactamase class A